MSTMRQFIQVTKSLGSNWWTEYYKFFCYYIVFTVVMKATKLHNSTFYGYAISWHNQPSASTSSCTNMLLYKWNLQTLIHKSGLNTNLFAGRRQKVSKAQVLIMGYVGFMHHQHLYSHARFKKMVFKTHRKIHQCTKTTAVGILSWYKNCHATAEVTIIECNFS
jgi:hypothetical protein